ncbi:MATE family efflux transporter [Alkaliphilus oremlandii]|uniref:MATE efflux family protein n=1 Tax=Alkaliphilus oremlandii (strain OhILAs) TaxID=350688 RepID=A8MKZ0_ALKOO|nr:MATE family efflux transporter [Alkaliphilus oremlandii]ABW17807.1 MATE efflux family protein [Alkaliphilus oremlandii OhILAs]
MFNNLIQTLYNLADTFWVSKLGTMPMAAMTLVSPVIFLTLSIGTGINVAGTALISQYIGSNDEEKSIKVSTQMFTFSVILSIILGIIGYLLTPFIVTFMGGQDEIFTYSSQYLTIMFWEIPGMFLFLVYTAIKQSQGDTFTPMVLNVLGVILNILLDPIFIFTFNMGIKGAAIATVLSRMIFALYAIYTLFAHKDGIYLDRNNLKMEKDILKEIIAIGLPSTLGQSAASFGFVILNSFVISYGANTLAAFGIGNRINSLVLMPVMGIGSALATIVGQNLGADKKDRAKLAVQTALKLSTILMVIGGVIMVIVSSSIVSIFVKDDPDVLQQGTEYLRLVSISLPLMGFFQVFVGTFQGSGHTIYAMMMDMGRLWGLRIPMIILFKNFTQWGPNGVWYAMLLSNAITCVFGFIIFLSGKWQKQVIHKKKALA